MEKAKLNKLIQAYGIEDVERHLVYSYLINLKLDYSASSILANYFKGFLPKLELGHSIASLNVSNCKELENYLELLIPSEDRKFNGAFFTPEYVVDFIINELKPQENATNIDLSCGCGAFLIGLADYYRRTFSKPVKKIIKENVFGADILEYNIHRAKIILTIYALQNEEYLEDTDFNLFHCDSLRYNWPKSFDNIVGNPPYVKFQDLSDDNRLYLANKWTTVEAGTFNLYFTFFELGYKLLEPQGKLGYITPNGYFTSLAGEALRQFFQKQKCVTRIVDFSHKKIFDAQTYTAITFLGKPESNAIAYDRIKDDQEPEAFLSKANGSLNYLKNLDVKKWRLLKKDEQSNIRKIEEVGDPLGTLYDICVGVATLKDDVFFVDTSKKRGNYYLKETDNGVFEIEKRAVKAVYKISDFKNEFEASKNKRGIIFPYRIKKGNAGVIPEEEFKVVYPGCYEYLVSEKQVLLSRDKGKITFEPFYVWGRTQGLKRTGKKILNPTFSQRPRFFLVDDEEAYFTNGYGLYIKQVSVLNPIASSENVDVLLKILNSSIMQYYISKTSVSLEGGYFCYQKNFIEKFTIPHLNLQEIEMLRNANRELADDFLIEKYQVSIPVPNRFS